MQQQDVRRPKNVHPYPARKQVEAEDNTSASLYQFFSLMLGMMCFIFKVKWACWGSLIMLLVSYTNMRFPTDFKQLLTSAGVVVVGFLSTYLAPYGPRAPSAPVPTK